MNFISTSALAKKQGISGKELFQKLEIQNYIKREKEKWILLKKGEESGAKVIKNSRYGEYIGWPENFIPENTSGILKENEYLNITTLSEEFEISSRKMNQILAELGWIEKSLKGWKTTKFGEKIGGKQLQHYKSGTSYTNWPKEIISNKSLIKAVNDFNPNLRINTPTSSDNTDKFRDKFPPTHRSSDGHMVRSRGEVLIDNFLYVNSLVHAYERKLPTEEDVYSDFYIPAQRGGEKVYIEYWGIEDQEKYESRKKEKREIYKKYDLNLIELENKHIDNLDDYLPRMLLQYGIKVD